MKLKVISFVCPALADSVTRVITVEQPASAVRMQPVNVLINEPLICRQGILEAVIYDPGNRAKPAVSNPKTTLSADQNTGSVSRHHHPVSLLIHCW